MFSENKLCVESSPVSSYYAKQGVFMGVFISSRIRSKANLLEGYHYFRVAFFILLFSWDLFGGGNLNKLARIFVYHVVYFDSVTYQTHAKQ